MKSNALRLLALCAVLFGVAAALQPWLSSGLPKVRLPDGRELRVLQIACGKSLDPIHDLAGESAASARLRKTLPQGLRRFMPRPAPGMPGIFAPGNSKMVSFWVVALKPREAYRLPPSTRGRGCDGSLFLSMTLGLHRAFPAFFDSLPPAGGIEVGSRQTDWHHDTSMMLVDADLQISAFRTGQVRQFILVNPPTDIRELRFAVPVRNDTPLSMSSSEAASRAHLVARESPIELTIPNPAYEKP